LSRIKPNFGIDFVRETARLMRKAGLEG